MKTHICMLTLCLIGMSTTAAYRDAQADNCTHYASPAGTGSGVSQPNSFRIADFWAHAKPGHVLCLTDGHYVGPASMINPPRYLKGLPGAPITVKALNDGKVTIDGQSVNRPVLLRNNDYIVLEGFNAHSSKDDVVELTSSNYNVVRRVAAWDAADGNTNIFGIHRGNYNLLEDVAGWGVARKIFSSSQGGDHTTIRRSWGRWEGSHVVGPKMTYTFAYNNRYFTCENCIGTWSGERIQETYTLLDYHGKPWTRKGAGTYSNYGVDQAYGVFAMDGLKDDRAAHSKILGSIAYVLATDRFPAKQVFFVTKIDHVEIADTIVYIEPRENRVIKPFFLNNLQAGAAASLHAHRLTAIGGDASSFGSDWRTSAISQVSTYNLIPNVFNSQQGANICNRYIGGKRTSKPLWPWPMNRRILEATRQSGRAPVDVTRTIETMFGTIPSRCKTE